MTTGRPSPHGLVALALRRPIAMLMVLLSMVVLGAVALTRIPLELVPSGFSPPFLRVMVEYPDATAKDVEERITRPLEQAVSTTPGLEQMTATSTEGTASIMLLFKADTDMNMAYRQVRDRVARARPELPSEVAFVQIRKESGEGLPVAFYGVHWDPALSDPHEVIDRHLVGPIERLEGVALVRLWGQEDPEIRIEVDRGLAEAAGVDMVALVQALGRSNFTLASGQVERDGATYLLRSVAKWGSPQEIAAIQVRPDLRLADIATVTFDRPPVTRHDRYRGRPSMVLSAMKESQANTVELSRRIEAVVARAQSHPEMQGVRIESIFLQGEAIEYSLRQVLESGWQGGLLALVVLAFFLRRSKLTILIALAIPLSLFLALPVMDFTGQSINIVSLVGLMICIGLVVDNSVVVAENIARYRRRGLGPYAAAMQGAGEVGLAITLATMTTVVVFLPAALLSEGSTQFLMVRMVTPVCVSLLASLFVALVLVPLASARWLGADDEASRGPRTGLAGALAGLDRAWKAAAGWLYRQSVDRLLHAYERLLRGALRRRIDVVMVALFAMGSMWIPAMNVHCESGQSFGARNINVRYVMPSDTTLADADAFFRGVEAELESLKDEYAIDGAYVGFDADVGEVQIFFLPPREGEPRFETFARELVDELPTPAGWQKTSRLGEGDGTGEDAFRIVLYGDDHERVQEAREALQGHLLRLPGVEGVREYGSDARRREELALSLDRELAQRFGVPADAVANTVAYAIRGTPLPRFDGERRPVDVRVRYREDDRRSVDQILGYRVPTGDGGTVPIGVLADREIQRGASQLTRSNKRVGDQIRLELDPERRPETVARIERFLAGYRLPDGITFDATEQTRRIDEMQQDLTGALGLGAVFIFLLMGFLFESLILPLSVLPSIPLSFVGVWWFLYATGESIDALAGIGMVLLLGVVVNNAIVLIDFVNQARAAGLERTEAILAAGRLRFRPILMTALTTVGGMLPLAFSQPTGEGIPYGPFGKALVGGMTTSTILTLVVVPVTYTYLDDLRVAAARWWQRLRS